jgi:hypothetical protein
MNSLSLKKIYKIILKIILIIIGVMILKIDVEWVIKIFNNN